MEYVLRKHGLIFRLVGENFMKIGKLIGLVFVSAISVSYTHLALLICGTAFSLCTVVFLLVSNSLYGWECTKTSIQMLYSIVNLSNLNLGQLQWICAGGYLLCMLATVSFTLFLSSRLRNVVEMCIRDSPSPLWMRMEIPC